MGTLNQQIKTFIRASYDYQLRKTDKNLNQLQRQLQILTVVSDLSIFQPTCMETLEFYVCLEQLLSTFESKSNVTLKVINLLAHICKSSAVKNALRDEIQILPPLSKVLIHSKSSREKTWKLVTLLHDISGGLKVNRPESWILELIPYLLTNIKESEDDEYTECYISLLGSLCRGNPPCLAILQNYTEKKALLKKLTDKKTPSIKLQLLLAESMIYLEGEYFKCENNEVSHFLDLLFSALLDSVVKRDEETVQLCRSIFQEFQLNSVIQQEVKTYTKYVSHCSKVLKKISLELPEPIISDIFSLISMVVQVESSGFDQCFELIFNSTIQCINKICAGSEAMALLSCIIQVYNSECFNDQLENLLEIVKGGLLSNVGDKNDSAMYLNWINNCISLLITLCQRDHSFYCSTICNYIDVPSLMATINVIEDSIECTPLLSSQTINPSLISRLSPGISNNCSQRFSETSSQEKNSEIILKFVQLIKLLSPYKQEYFKEYDQMLKSSKVLVHLAKGLRSCNQSVVSLSLSLLCDGTFKDDVLPEMIRVQHNLNTQVVSEKENVQIPIPQVNPTCEENIENVLKQLNMAGEKSDIRDAPVLDIMELYEYKLASLAHSERSLNEALTAADDHKRKIQQTLLQCRAENSRLKNLLQNWEMRLIESQEQKASVEQKVVDVTESAQKFREKLLKEKVTVERELSCLQKELQVANSNLQLKIDEQRRTEKKLFEVEDNNKGLQNHIQEQEKKYAKLQEKVNKQEEAITKKQKDEEDLVKENSKLDKQVRELKKEIEGLKIDIRGHEQTIMEKDSELQELASTNSQLKRIQDMIHNISAGKSSSKN